MITHINALLINPKMLAPENQKTEQNPWKAPRKPSCNVRARLAANRGKACGTRRHATAIPASSSVGTVADRSGARSTASLTAQATSSAEVNIAARYAAPTVALAASVAAGCVAKRLRAVPRFLSKCPSSLDGVRIVPFWNEIEWKACKRVLFIQRCFTHVLSFVWEPCSLRQPVRVLSIFMTFK